jgi:hypothetical protein
VQRSIEAGRAELHLETVDLVALVTHSIEQTTTPVERARIEVAVLPARHSWSSRMPHASSECWGTC